MSLLRSASVCVALMMSGAIASNAMAEVQPRSATDLAGVWLLSGDGLGGGNSMLNKRPQTQWSDGQLPFSAEGKQVLQANKPGKGPRRVKAALGNDPIGGANPPGLYRTLVYGRPFEFLQTKDKLVQVFELSRVWRAIYTDGRPVPDEIAAGPYWYGYSVGKWEGDTLVVTTLALDERAWLDEWGTPFSMDARFEERWRRLDADTLQLELTVHDPTFYAKPWTSSPMIYKRQAKLEPQEIIYAPMDEEAFNQEIRDPAGLPKAN